MTVKPKSTCSIQKMVRLQLFVLAVCLANGVICQPLKGLDTAIGTGAGRSIGIEARPRLWRRFVNPELTLGSFSEVGLSKMRTRRSSEEGCEKLQLCKLHARSNRNFLAAFELYFVNKENARLWDHKTARSAAECERRFAAGCYGNAAPAPAPRQKQYQFVHDDDYE